MIKTVFLSVFVALIALSGPAHAQSNVVDFKTLESLGLYERSRDGSLGRDLWKNTKRADMVALIEKLPDNPRTRILYQLQKRALLTSATANFSREGAPEPGKDLLTARMDKLVAMGAYQEVKELYQKLDSAPYHDRLGELGVLGYLYTGEKSLACIEAKILKDQTTDEGEDQKLWRDLIAYCNASLSDKPADEDKKIIAESDYAVFKNMIAKKSYKFTYKPAAFEKLSWLAQAILVAEDRLDLSDLDTQKLTKVPTRHLNALLVSEQLSDKDKTRLTVEAMRRGATPPNALTTLYAAQYKPAAGEEAEEAPKGSFEKLSYLHYHIGQAPRAEKWELMQDAFKLEKDFGIEALTPLAQILAQMSPENLSAKEIDSALRIFYAANISPPSFWLQNSSENKKSSKKIDQKIQILAHLMRPSSTNSSSETLGFLQDTEKKGKNPYISIKNIIENLDKGNKADHNAPTIYEKDFDIASMLVYKVPQQDVWDRLKETSQNQNKAETILLSAALLHKSHLKDIYPGFLRDVFSSFEAVGLTKVSRDLAIEAFLEN